MKLWIGAWNNPIVVSWQYTAMKQGRRMTTCRVRFLNVKDENGADYEVVGYAYQHKADAFDKEKGRKLSLKRALEMFEFTRKERAQVWKAYFSRGAIDAGELF